MRHNSKYVLAIIVVLCFALVLAFAGCNNSPDEDTGGEVNPTPHTHAWGEWTLVKLPTNADEGGIKRVCACGEEEAKVLPIINETNYVITVISEPTCLVQGRSRLTLKGDTNYSFEIDTQAVGHKFGEWEMISTPSLTNKGVIARECAVCHEAKSYILPMLDSNKYTKTTILEPTCTAIGQDKYTYILNDEEVSFFVDIPATGHRQKQGTNYCEVCSEVIDDSIFTYKLLPDDTYIISDYTDKYFDIIIPAVHNGKAVTQIANEAIFGAMTLTNVTIQSGVQGIGYSAFRGCWNLKTITIPSSVTTIGEMAFSGCSKLVDITIPDSVAEIGPKMLDGCNALASIVVGENNEKYTSRDAQGHECNAIIERNTSILIAGCKDTIIPDFVVEIGGFAFSNQSDLTSITIPDSVKKIGNNAFDFCFTLESINIPNGVTSIGDSAFNNCSALQSITIPDSIVTIGKKAFNGCSGFSHITIPNSVTTISAKMFAQCDNLESVTIPNSVTTIEESAFDSCRKLKSIIIPSSVTTMGDNAFYSCDRVNIFTEATSQPGGWANTWSGNHAAIYWYSETQPTTIPTFGTGYWHYGIDNVPTIWEIK